MAGKTFQIRIADREHELAVESFADGRLRARIDGEEIEAVCRLAGDGLVQLVFSDRSEWVRLARIDNRWHAACRGCHLLVEPLTRRRAGQEKELPPEVTPPMPAVVVKVLTQPGDQVSRGQALVVVSAMKMEVTLKAPRDGTVSEVLAREGDQVSPGQVLVMFEEEKDGSE